MYETKIAINDNTRIIRYSCDSEHENSCSSLKL